MSRSPQEVLPLPDLLIPTGLSTLSFPRPLERGEDWSLILFPQPAMFNQYPPRVESVSEDATLSQYILDTVIKTLSLIGEWHGLDVKSYARSSTTCLGNFDVAVQINISG